ncbi:MAG: sulfotransferase [Cyanobacteria bacterium]|nr:sulfotransferase [Cyanobacteriota bacterium]
MLPAIPSIQRFFLVGCPRSGTTLLQSLLAAHPAIISFPESQFFTLAPARPGEKRYVLKMASHRARKCTAKFLDESNLSGYKTHIPQCPWPEARFCRGVLNILDKVAWDAEKQAWLEKSPAHLHHIEFIEKISSPVKFIHIIRNALDVIASMYAVRLKHSGHWRMEPPDIDLAIQRWLKDTEISLNSQAKKNHIVVKYEDLVSDPAVELTRVLEFLGFEFQASILKGYNDQAKSLILPFEHWKSENIKPIKSRNGIKFKSVFSQAQQDYILATLAEAGHCYALDPSRGK